MTERERDERDTIGGQTDQDDNLTPEQRAARERAGSHEGTERGAAQPNPQERHQTRAEFGD